MMETIDFWRLCERFSFVQAALLLGGHDPTHLQSEIERKASKEQPEEYTACRTAIESAVMQEKIAGKIEYGTPDFENAEPRLCYHSSWVEVESFKDWLIEKGFRNHFFFFSDGVEDEFLDVNHPRYAPKLAAAVLAWRALDDPESLKTRSPKQAIQKWLNEHASQFDLCDSEGKPTESAIEEIAKVANWQTKGGAPSTPANKTKNQKATKKTTKSGILSLDGPHTPSELEPNGYELNDDVPF